MYRLQTKFMDRQKYCVKQKVIILKILVVLSLICSFCVNSIFLIRGKSCEWLLLVSFYAQITNPLHNTTVDEKLRFIKFRKCFVPPLTLLFPPLFPSVCASFYLQI